MLDLGVHALDLCLWTMGYPRVESVSASVHRPRSPEGCLLYVTLPAPIEELEDGGSP